MYWYGRLSVLLLVLLASMPLSSCDKALPFLTGGGPNVAANTQLGKTNTQTLGVSSSNAPTVSLRPQSRVDQIDQSTKTQNDTNPVVWVVFGLLIALAMYLMYLLPSPKTS
jgi:hypothetical protein